MTAAENPTDRPAEPGHEVPELPADRVAEVEGWDVPPREDRVRKSFGPKRGMCAGVLAPEAIVLGLSAPVLMSSADIDKAVALPVGFGLAIACLLAAGMLKRPLGYWIGHAVQVVAVALGFVVPVMFFIGGLFAVMWFMGIKLGDRIAVEKQAAWNRWEAEQLGLTDS